MTDSSIRVALVSRASAALHGPGGLERHVDDLARQLLERGVAVTLLGPPLDRERGLRLTGFVMSG